MSASHAVHAVGSAVDHCAVIRRHGER